MPGIPGSQRDDLIRLRWVEERIKKLAANWRRDADALRESSTDAAVTGGAAELDGCAAEVTAMLAESHADGGPPADHLTDGALHLAALTRQARQSGRPLPGRLADAIAVITGASAAQHPRPDPMASRRGSENRG